jgi:hypothetical protein
MEFGTSQIVPIHPWRRLAARPGCGLAVNRASASCWGSLPAPTQAGFSVFSLSCVLPAKPDRFGHVAVTPLLQPAGAVTWALGHVSQTDAAAKIHPTENRMIAATLT